MVCKTHRVGKGEMIERERGKCPQGRLTLSQVGELVTCTDTVVATNQHLFVTATFPTFAM